MDWVAAAVAAAAAAANRWLAGREGERWIFVCVYEFASFIVMEFKEIKLMNNKKFWWQRWKRTRWLSGLLLRICRFLYCLHTVR